jgi:hypothetical protein
MRDQLMKVGAVQSKLEGKAPRRDSNPSEKGSAGSGATEAGDGAASKQRKKPGVPKISCLPPQASYPSPPHSPHLESANTGNDNPSYYDNKADVLAWADTVIKTGPPDKVPNTLMLCTCTVWGKLALLGAFHGSDGCEFTSNDWAIKRFLCKLTRARSTVLER